MTISNSDLETKGNLLFIGVVAILLIFSSCRENQNTKETGTIETDNYDSTLAKSLGADEYGMHQYVMAFLKEGPNRTLDSAEAMELQMSHMKHIKRMADAGDLVLAGPFLDTGELRGVYIFDVKTIEEARSLTLSDPAIQAGSLVMELKPWYGSAALMEVSKRHKRITKTKF